tara:strand:+ start:496 stop:654 length:159 start_codon:yes stop_codon:yes gene_type:complete
MKMRAGLWAFKKRLDTDMKAVFKKHDPAWKKIHKRMAKTIKRSEQRIKKGYV